jgi:hypothetical protein
MILRACLVLLRSLVRGLTGRNRRRIRVVRLLPHGTPHRRPAPLRAVRDSRRPGTSGWAGRGPR